MHKNRDPTTDNCLNSDLCTQKELKEPRAPHYTARQGSSVQPQINP